MYIYLRNPKLINLSMLSWNIVFLVLKWGNIVFYEKHRIFTLISKEWNILWKFHRIFYPSSHNFPRRGLKRHGNHGTGHNVWPQEWWFAAKKETIILNHPQGKVPSLKARKWTCSMAPGLERRPFPLPFFALADQVADRKHIANTLLSWGCSWEPLSSESLSCV